VGTWAQALRDPSIPIHWLLEIDVSGLTWRFADRSVIVESTRYLGALEMSREPSLESDPYQGQTGVIASTVILKPIVDGGADRPLFRPHDLGDTYRQELIDLPTRLYRWAEGTPMSERDLVIDGHISDATIRRERDLELELADFALHYSRKILPPYLIDVSDWATTDEDDVGRRAPVVYGTFTGLEVPNIVNDGTHMIGHHIGSVTGGQVEGASATPALTNTTDANGVPYADLDYAVATAEKTATVNGTGVLDDADGTYSGTASALLAHTADQLHHLARNLGFDSAGNPAGIPVEKIDRASFYALRQLTPSHTNALIIGASDKANYFQVAQVALKPYRASVFVEHGKLTARALNFNALASYALRDGEFLKATEEIQWRGYSQVPAGLEIKYARKWNKKRKQYENSAVFRLPAEDYAPFLISEDKGAEPLRMEYPYVNDATTVEALAQEAKELHSFCRRRIKAAVTRDCHDIRLYSIVTMTAASAPSVDGEGWTDKRLAVIGITYGVERNVLTLLEC
jgi:hypothetical protein